MRPYQAIDLCTSGGPSRTSVGHYPELRDALVSSGLCAFLERASFNTSTGSSFNYYHIVGIREQNSIVLDHLRNGRRVYESGCRLRLG